MAKKTNTDIGKYKYYRIRRKVGMKQNRAGAWVPEYKFFYGKSQKEALDKYDEYISKGLLNSAACFGEFLSWYIDNVFLIDNSLKASTKSIYVNAYINALSGSKLLGCSIDTITGSDIQQALTAAPVAQTTKRQALKLIRSFYKYLEAQHIAKDISSGVIIPAAKSKKENQDIVIFTDEEINKFISEIPQDHRLRLLIILAINTGCRIAELLALKYEDISADQININKSLVEIEAPKNRKNEEGATIQEISTTKTISSVRSIPLSDLALTELKKHKQWHRKEMLKNGYRTDFIFTTSSGHFYYQSTLRKSFSRLCRSLDIAPRGFHAFRHTFGTRLAAAGVPIQTVSKLMGHTDINVTSKYYINIPTNEKIAAIKALNI